jgi:nucleotide-binding universal stress UspA family protein
VMGLGRHGIIERVIGTETALRAIQLAPCPVLAVAPGLSARPRTVVVATDFSTDGVRAAERVLPFVAADATLHLVHVWESANSADERLRLRDEEYRRQLPARFAQVVAALAPPAGVTLKCEAREGRPAARLLDFAAAHSADLIVAGRHGIGAFRRLLVGSVTSALVRGAHCSVFIVPEPSPAQLARLPRVGACTTETGNRLEWPELLHAFARRNAGRAVTLDASADGALSRDLGYTFLDASYDRESGRVELVLGTHHRRIVQRVVGATEVSLVGLTANGVGVDTSLVIEHEAGRAALLFAVG